MALDNNLLGEINRRASKFRVFKSLKTRQYDLDLLESQDKKYIRGVCEEKGFEVTDYVKYYRGKIK